MKMIRLINHGLTFLILLVCMPILFMGMSEIGKYVGIVKLVVPVAGTGSMYPSLYWDKSEGGPDDRDKGTPEHYRIEPSMYRYFQGFQIFGKTYLKPKLQRGDLVAFKNETTKSILASEGRDNNAGFIKRLVGIPGDTIELRDGYLLVNGVKVKEPYIAKGRSTYGNSFLPDCTKLTVEEGSYFVLGDNRKTSSDSRGQLGLIKENDLLFYLPLSKQGIYKSLWRDTEDDLSLANAPTLNVGESVTLLNNYRKEKSAKKLTLNPLLNRSSSLRSDKIIETADFTTTATSSGYTFTTAMRSAGYSNIATGEVVSHGFYTAEEWVANLTYFKETAKQVANPDYQDVGISVKKGEINGCPTQVIVGHFGGYIPPDYSEELIASWTKLRKNLEEVLPGWREVKDYNGVDQDKLQKLISILETRLSLAKEVEQAMNNKLWLTKDQEAKIASDVKLAEEANKLIEDLNK